MNNVEKVIAIATAEIGYLEKKSNSQLDDKIANAGSNNFTKYWRDMYPSYQGNAWCDCFVDWCFTKAYGKDAAQKLECGGCGVFYTPTSAKKYKDAKQWFTSPKVGDQIFFRNSKRICHTGIVYKVDSKYVYTIEGNTSGASGVIANGGGVCKKQYALNSSYIAGYGRPKYDVAETFKPYKVKTTADLNIREGVGTTTKIVGLLKKGHEFTIREEKSGWGRVCVISDSNKKTVNGWVSLKYTQRV